MVSNVCQWMFDSIHTAKQECCYAGDVYLKECTQRRLIPFIERNHLQGKFIFWPDLARAHYTPQVLRTSEANDIPYTYQEKLILLMYHKYDQSKICGVF